MMFLRLKGFRIEILSLPERLKLAGITAPVNPNHAPVAQSISFNAYRLLCFARFRLTFNKSSQQAKSQV